MSTLRESFLSEIPGPHRSQTRKKAPAGDETAGSKANDDDTLTRRIERERALKCQIKIRLTKRLINGSRGSR